MIRSAREHPQVVYEEFDPPSEWVHEEKGDIVLMDVSGFKKDELKVFLESDGRISVSGERPIDEDDKIRIRRFRKELSQPENCKANEIKAKFDCGILYIIMPKQRQQEEDEPPPKTTTKTTQEAEAEPESEPEPSQNDANKMESQATNSNSCPRGKEEGSSSSNNGVVSNAIIARRGGLSSNLRHLVLILVVVILVLGLGRRINEEVFKFKSS